MSGISSISSTLWQRGSATFNQCPREVKVAALATLATASCVAAIYTIKILAIKFFSRLLRISVFQLGVYNEPFSYFLMRLFQMISSDPHAGLEDSKKLLKSYGGAEETAEPSDGGAKIRYMWFKPGNAEQRIRDMGGVIDIRNEGESSGPLHVVRPADTPPSPNYKDLLNELEKFGLKSHTEKGISVVFLPKALQEPVAMLRCHSPDRLC